MQQQQTDFSEQQDVPVQPRPLWQIWAARVALVVFIALIIMYYVNIARGGI